jgi:hypothetical protein
MDLMRCTVIDSQGSVSFVIPCEALPAMVAACCNSPRNLGEFLDSAESYFSNLREPVLNGLAVFDEFNIRGSYQTIHKTLKATTADQQPVFRIVDETTREASLQPVKAGVVLFNLKAKRIVQLMNTYREIRRTGYARVFTPEGLSSTVFSYRLPREWALVP